MRIEECVPCPRCGYRRVVQHGRTTYVCFQCRHSWSVEPGAAPPRQRPADLLGGFSSEQRLRLTAYRAAIQVGLYTDWPPPRAS
jgi:DNA-directed RNA polymerase subunit RPC12/RpoP